MDITSAVVLAAGEGQRLRPLTEYRPKPMLPVANKPILEHVLDALINAGIDDLHIVVGYGKDRVQTHFGPTHRDRTITYHTQDKQLGSGHALLQAQDAISEDFLVTNGDEVVTPGFVSAVLDAHAAEHIATVGVIESERASQFGSVQLEGSRITELVEQSAEAEYRLMNAGIYVFGPSIFSEIESTPQRNGEQHLTDTLSQLIDRTGNVHGTRTGEPRTEVTYPWDLLELNAELLDSGAVGGLPAVRDDVYVAETAQVDETAELIPPVAIGADTVVGPNAVVGPDVALGTNVTVGAGSCVENTVVSDDSRMGRSVTISDTISSVGANIESAVTMIGGTGPVQIGSTVYEDVELGCVIGDRAEIGGGVITEPGTLIGPDTTVGHGVVVDQDIPKETTVVR